MTRHENDRISPTALYTGHVWYRNGLSHPVLATGMGRALFAGQWVIDRVASLRGSPSFESIILDRHHLIDRVLHRAVETGQIGQVVEIGAGLSFRGVRFARKFPELTYVEGDLPQMSARKRAQLEKAGLVASNHEILALDALAEDGDASFGSVARKHLEPEVGTAIITEGLLNYFDPDAVSAMWDRFLELLRSHPAGLYLADLFLARQVDRLPGGRVSKHAIKLVSRGAVYLPFEDPDDYEAGVQAAGFDRCEVHGVGMPSDDRKREAAVLGIVEAWTDGEGVSDDARRGRQ